jgi:Holliday junction resolvase-like predicted endonuclease/predicted transport protein
MQIMTRRKDLGNLGERWTVRLLERARFRNIQDLNQRRYNHPGGDFLAERDGVHYFITVKSRNKYRRGTRSLNGGYNIFPEKVRKFAKHYDAVPAWLTIQIDTDLQCFSAYFGTVDSLHNPTAVAVPMVPSAAASYECLAKDCLDAHIVPELSNQLTETLTRPPAPARRLKPAVRVARTPMSAGFNDHYNYTDEERRPLLTRIRSKLVELDNRLIERVTARRRIAYSKPGRNIFLEVKVERHAIALHMIDVPDPGQILSKIPESHGWRQLTGRVKITSSAELERVLPLIQNAWLRG